MATTGTLTNVNDTVVFTGNGELTVMWSVYTTTSMSGTVAFEVSSNGTNWFPIAAIRQSDGASVTSDAITSNTQYLVPANSQQVRVKLTAITTPDLLVRAQGLYIPMSMLLSAAPGGNISQLGGTSLVTPASTNTPVLPTYDIPASLYLSGSVTPSSASSGTITIGSLLQGGNAIADVASVLVAFSNTCNQTITGATLSFTDTLNGQTVTHTYTIPLDIPVAATTGTKTVLLPLPRGLLKTAAVGLTYGGTVSAGTTGVSLTFLRGTSGQSAFTSLNAATADANGTTCVLNGVRTKHALQVILTGSPSGGTVVLQGSVNGSNFDTTALATFTIGTDASGIIKYAVDKPLAAVRAVLASLSGGSAPTVTAVIASSN